MRVRSWSLTYIALSVDIAQEDRARKEARRMGAIEAIVTIGTSFVLISLFRALTHIERRYRVAWGGAEKAGGKRLAKSGEKRKLFTVYRLGKIRKYGRFLT